LGEWKKATPQACDDFVFALYCAQHPQQTEELLLRRKAVQQERRSRARVNRLLMEKAKESLERTVEQAISA